VDKDRRALMDKVRKQIKKSFGEATAVDPSSEEADLYLKSRVNIWVPTGSDLLDCVLGKPNHGLPSGKISEIYGQEGHGKSSLALWIIGQFQKAGGMAFLNDTELSFDPEWAAKLGVSVDELTVFPLIPRESCLEQYMDMMVDVMSTIRASDPLKPLLFVHDTAYATPTKEDLESESFMDTSRIARLARAFSACLPTFNGYLSHYDASLILINQVRDNVNVLYGDKITTPGGRAVNHFSSIRAVVRRKSKIDGGIESEVVNVKTKLTAPFQKARFKLTEARGFRMVVPRPKTKKGEKT
jgi:recombination protein RecA